MRFRKKSKMPRCEKNAFEIVKKSVAVIMSFINILFLCLCFTSCSIGGVSGEYTYRTYTSALGTNWNPHTWENSADNEIMDYLVTPFVSALPDGAGSYTWHMELAESVTDVSASCRPDLLEYGCDLGGKNVGEINDGYVYEIKLREGLVFENGEKIGADEFIRSMELLLSPRMKNSRANLYITAEAALAGAKEYFEGEIPFSKVGIYKTGDNSFRYVSKSHIEHNYFLSHLTSNWLVSAEKYEAGYRESGGLLSTDYNSTPESTVSYGPYKIASYQSEKEMVLVRNEAWYGWKKSDTGRLVSHITLPASGEVIEQYMSTKVVISVMDAVTAKQSFLRGELSSYIPSADEYSVYELSDALYSAGETYTMSLFFNSDKDALLRMDRSRGNKNSVVLSNQNFRHAMSLATDRAEFCTATQGYTPVYSLLNDMYYYDIYNDPNSVFRESDAAKMYICNLYETAWGEGTPYPTLDAAYKSINGYNISLSREYFRRAFEELVNAGLYVAGEPIKIRIAWAKGALTSDDNKQVALLSRYLNAALKDTGFGKITLEVQGQISNRYSAVPSGEYAMGYGAWGGAAFYPFRTLRVYMDDEYANLHEAACWNPDKEMLTLTILGEERTMTYKEWSRSTSGIGVYAGANIETKLEITAALEQAFLEKYYRIPLAASRTVTMLSYQIENYTREYHVMYGFGEFRLLRYNYDDAEWASYVSRSGGRLSYE